MKRTIKTSATVFTALICLSMFSVLSITPVASAFVPSLGILPDPVAIKSVLVKAGITQVSESDIQTLIDAAGADAPPELLSYLQTAKAELKTAKEIYQSAEGKMSAAEKAWIAAMGITGITIFRHIRVPGTNLFRRAHVGSVGTIHGVPNVSKIMDETGRHVIHISRTPGTAVTLEPQTPAQTGAAAKGGFLKGTIGFWGIVSLVGIGAAVTASWMAESEYKSAANHFVKSAVALEEASKYISTQTIVSVGKLELLGVKDIEVASYMGIDNYYSRYLGYVNKIGAIRMIGSDLSVGGRNQVVLNRVTPSSATILSPMVADVTDKKNSLSEAVRATKADLVESNVYINIVTKVRGILDKTVSVYVSASADVTSVTKVFSDRISSLDNQARGIENQCQEAIKKKIHLVDASMVVKVTNAFVMLGIGPTDIIITPVDVALSPAERLREARRQLGSAGSSLSQAATILSQEMGYYGKAVMLKLKDASESMIQAANYVSAAVDDTKGMCITLKTKLGVQIPIIKALHQTAIGAPGVSNIIIESAGIRISRSENNTRLIDNYTARKEWGNAFVAGATAIDDLAIAFKLLKNNMEELRIIGRETALLIEKLDKIIVKASGDGISTVSELQKVLEAKQLQEQSFQFIRQGDMDFLNEVVDRLITARAKANEAYILIRAKYEALLNELDSARAGADSVLDTAELVFYAAKSAGLPTTDNMERELVGIRTRFNAVDDNYVTNNIFDLDKVAGHVSFVKGQYTSIRNEVTRFLSTNEWLVPSVLGYDVTVRFPEGVTGGVYSTTVLTIRVTNRFTSAIASFPIRYALAGRVDRESLIVTGAADYYFDVDRNELVFFVPELAPAGQVGSTKTITATFKAMIADVIQTPIRQLVENINPQSPALFYTDVTVTSVAGLTDVPINVLLPTATLLTDTILVYDVDNCTYTYRTEKVGNLTKVIVLLPSLRTDKSKSFTVLFEQPAPTVSFVSVSTTQVVRGGVVVNVVTERVQARNMADITLRNVYLAYNIPGGINAEDTAVRHISTFVEPDLEPDDVCVFEMENYYVLAWRVKRMPGFKSTTYDIIYETTNIAATASYLSTQIRYLADEAENIINSLAGYGFDMAVERTTLSSIRASKTVGDRHISDGRYAQAVELLRQTWFNTDDLVKRLLTTLETYTKIQKDLDRAEVELRLAAGYAGTLRKYPAVADAAGVIDAAYAQVLSKISEARAAIGMADISTAKTKLDEAQAILSRALDYANGAVNTYATQRYDFIYKTLNNIIDQQTILTSLGVEYLSGLGPSIDEARQARDALLNSLNSRNYTKALIDVGLAENKVLEAKRILDTNISTVVKTVYTSYRQLTLDVSTSGVTYKTILDSARNAVTLTYTPVVGIGALDLPYTTAVVAPYDGKWETTYRAATALADTSRQTAEQYYANNQFFDLLALVSSNRASFIASRTSLASDITALDGVVSTVRTIAVSRLDVVESTLIEVRQELNRAKEVKTDVTAEEIALKGAEDYIRLARKANDEGRYSDVIAYTADAKAKLDQIKTSLGYLVVPKPPVDYTGLFAAISAALIVLLGLLLVMIKKKKILMRRKAAELEVFETI